MAMTNVFTGASGTLLVVSENDPAGQDAQAILDAYDTMEVGRVKGVEVHVNTELEEFHELGARHPVSLHPGNVHISGRIDRAYVNGALLWLLLGRGANPTATREPYVQPTFFMNIVLADPAVPGNRAIVNVYGVKFENWAYVVPEDDFVLENLTFKALRVNVQDEEAPSGGGDAQVKAPFPAESTT